VKRLAAGCLKSSLARVAKSARKLAKAACRKAAGQPLLRRHN